jgi:hypothetical protein
MTEQDQKYLAEKMGIEFRTLKDFNYFYSPRNLVATWDSPVFFFFCFEWAKKQEWWEEFLKYMWGVSISAYVQFCVEYPPIPICMIGPPFAEELVGFLRSREGGDVK